MSGEMRAKDFERELLGHVEMLYGVALKLTQDPCDAETITRSALQEAWKEQANLNGHGALKAELLKLLRRTFQDRHGVKALLGLSPERKDARSGKPTRRRLVGAVAAS